MLVIPAWLVFSVSHLVTAVLAMAAYRAWANSRPVQYMKLQAGLDKDGNPTLQPIYWDDESVALREHFGPAPSASIPGLDDGR